jgi:hypothetical protein
VDSGDDSSGTLGAELAGHRERGDLGAMADLVGQHAAEPGDLVLVAEVAVYAHVGRPERSCERVGRDVERFGPETVEGRTVDCVVGDAPHSRSSFRAGFGQQQRRRLGEHEPCLAVARFQRLLLVDEQAPTLHEVHHEGHRLELQLQVLAAPPHELEGETVGHIRSWNRCLQRGEGEWMELDQFPSGELRGEPLGMRLNFR